MTPQLKVFLNGSLNVPIDVLEANRAIERRSGLGPGRGFLALLDEQRVDVFLGAGEPRVSLPGRPAISTTTHLEGVPGWIMVFRNMRSAIYLRDVTRNRANLRRVADYYAAEGVPFDPQRGFAPLQVLQASPGWAVAHGLVPLDFEQTRAAARSPVPAIRARAQARLASIYAVTGVYERAVDLDQRLLRSDPGSVPSARRLVWALLHLRRLEEGLAAAERLAEIASPEDRLSGSIVLTARHAASRSEEEHAAWVALLPVLTRPEGHRLFRGYSEPADRPGRNPQSRH